MNRMALCVFLAIALHCCVSVCQPTQTNGAAMFRTYMIESTHGRGTVFSINVDDREYWITAKHIFTGLKTGPAGVFTDNTVTANILSNSGTASAGNDQHWLTERFTILDPGKDIDILVLVPNLPLVPKGASLKTSGTQVGIGGDCEFLGFPYGGGWKMEMEGGQSYWSPYVKHCTVSAILVEKGLRFWVLDGINNEGF